MKIVTYNIQFGCGRDGKVDLDRTVEAVHDADVISLQEVDRYWPRSGGMDQVKLIVEKLPGFDVPMAPRGRSGDNGKGGHGWATDTAAVR